jgi:hypothetical protein
MPRWFRTSLLIISLVQILVAIACLLRLPIVESLWPLDYTGEMSFIFVALIAAAAAASTLWCVYADEPGALFGIGLDYVTIFTPVAISMFGLASRNSNVIGFAVFCVIASLFGLGLLIYSRKQSFVDPRPMPRLLRFFFVGFVLALLIGGSWVLVVPFLNMLPTIPDHWRFNLLLYMSIVVSSGILSAYYLFLSPLTQPAGR